MPPVLVQVVDDMVNNLGAAFIVRDVSRWVAEMRDQRLSQVERGSAVGVYGNGVRIAPTPHVRASEVVRVLPAPVQANRFTRVSTPILPQPVGRHGAVITPVSELYGSLTA